MKKRIVTGITMGEPAGISSEITLKIWKNHRKKIEPFIFFGDPIHLLKTSGAPGSASSATHNFQIATTSK